MGGSGIESGDAFRLIFGVTTEGGSPAFEYYIDNFTSSDLYSRIKNRFIPYVLTYNGDITDVNSFELYIDNQLVEWQGKRIRGSLSSFNMSNFHIARFGNNYSDIKTCNIQVFDRVISYEEILEYSKGKKLNNPSCFLPCAEGDGSRLIDETNNNNIGILIGANWSKQNIYHHNYHYGFKVLPYNNGTSDQVYPNSSNLASNGSKYQADIDLILYTNANINTGINLYGNSTTTRFTISTAGCSIRVVNKFSGAVKPNLSFKNNLQYGKKYKLTFIREGINTALYLDGVFQDIQDLSGSSNPNATIPILGDRRIKAGSGTYSPRGYLIEKVVYKIDDVIQHTLKSNSDGVIENIETNDLSRVLPRYNGGNINESFIKKPLNYQYNAPNVDLSRVVMYKPSQRNHNGSESKIDFNPYNTYEFSNLGIQEYKGGDLIKVGSYDNIDRIVNFNNRTTGFEPETLRYRDKMNGSNISNNRLKKIDDLVKSIKYEESLKTRQYSLIEKFGILFFVQDGIGNTSRNLVSEQNMNYDLNVRFNNNITAFNETDSIFSTGSSSSGVKSNVQQLLVYDFGGYAGGHIFLNRKISTSDMNSTNTILCGGQSVGGPNYTAYIRLTVNNSINYAHYRDSLGGYSTNSYDTNLYSVLRTKDNITTLYIDGVAKSEISNVSQGGNTHYSFGGGSKNQNFATQGLIKPNFWSGVYTRDNINTAKLNKVLKYFKPILQNPNL